MKNTLTRKDTIERAKAFLYQVKKDPNISALYFLNIQRAFFLKAMCHNFNDGDGGYSSPCLKKCHPNMPNEKCKYAKNMEE